MSVAALENAFKQTSVKNLQRERIDEEAHKPSYRKQVKMQVELIEMSAKLWELLFNYFVEDRQLVLQSLFSESGR